MKNKSFTFIKAFSILSVTLLSINMKAQQIELDEAQQIAANFFTGSQQHPSKSHRTSMQVSIPLLAYTAQTKNVTDFYVFNNSNASRGFVIVAGNHQQPNILGYSLENTFDIEKIPDNFKWWMEQYQSNGTTRKNALKKFWHDVEPLIKTKWGQEEPYNSAIPHMEGFQPFVTGCTSTAIAQVMNYYQYPQKGEGSNSYQITYNDENALKITFSADFNTTYDWNNMLDDYSHGYSQMQADAVATLMYHIGVSEGTSYSDIDHGSSASLHDGAIAMIEYFNYDKSMETAERKHFTDDEWERIIYHELENGRPVLYSGRTSFDSGHSFIIHAYDAEENLYAINWGWDGYCDGYYILTGPNSLSPHDGNQYIGAKYDEDQCIYVNIKPNEGGEPVPIIASLDHVFMSTISESAPIHNYQLNRITDEDLMLYLQISPHNSGLFPTKFLYGVMLMNRENGHTIYPDESQTNQVDLGVNYYYTTQVEFSTSLLQYNGIYEVLPAFSTDNGKTWQPMRTDTNNEIPTISVTGGMTMTQTTYTLTYLVDGEKYEELQLKSGTTITPEPEPTKEGYAFSGWSEIPATMPTHDVTITGSFTYIDAINNIIKDDKDYQIYTASGTQFNTLQKGVNILRYSNGTTKKVFVK